MTLTASDRRLGDGKATYYKIDNGSWTAGTTFTISGDATHTFSYYSVDNANNTRDGEHVERLPHRHDATVDHVELQPDVGRGLQRQPVGDAHRHRTAGPASRSPTTRSTAERWPHYTAPFAISGDATHTFTYYSVDNANNTETAHVSNVFRIDTTPPVTTCNAVANQVYQGNTTFTLTPTDRRVRRGEHVVAARQRVLDLGHLDRGHRPRLGRGLAHDLLLLDRRRHQQGDDASVTFTMTVIESRRR